MLTRPNKPLSSAADQHDSQAAAHGAHTPHMLPVLRRSGPD